MIRKIDMMYCLSDGCTRVMTWDENNKIATYAFRDAIVAVDCYTRLVDRNPQAILLEGKVA